MTQTLTTPKGPVQLHWSGGQVLVTPEDEDRFVMASRQAISACQGAVILNRALSEFMGSFLAKLHQWCMGQRHTVRACYVPFQSPSCAIKVFMLRQSGEFDFELSDAISDLEVELDAAGWPTDILQIAGSSPEEILSFFDPAQSIQVLDDGNGSRASAEG